MEQRSNPFWAIAGALALAIFLALLCPAPVAAGPSSGMSAPAAPAGSLDSSSAGTYQSHFEWESPALAPAACALPFSSVPPCVESPDRASALPHC